jgi:hypothetical protein
LWGYTGNHHTTLPFLHEFNCKSQFAMGMPQPFPKASSQEFELAINVG